MSKVTIQQHDGTIVLEGSDEWISKILEKLYVANDSVKITFPPVPSYPSPFHSPLSVTCKMDSGPFASGMK